MMAAPAIMPAGWPRFTSPATGTPKKLMPVQPYGANGVRAESADDVSSALEAALREDRPSVIEVGVDADTITSFRRDSFPHRVARGAATG